MEEQTMNEPYLIVLDLDGTLLNNEKQISSHTKHILHKCRELGHEVMIATGRPFRASESYYQELKLTTPIVNFNGAHVHYPNHPEWEIKHSPIPRPAALAVLETCQLFHIKNVMVEVLDTIFVEKMDHDLLNTFNLDISEITVGPITQNLKTDPTSVLIRTEPQDLDNLMEALDSNYAETIEQRSWGYPSDIIEIIQRGVSKATGLARVADYLGIPKERIIAFGDESNDIEMLQFAGMGVAMGNAKPEIKGHAHFVTSSNEEEGISTFLENTLLK
jgi:Cof subfamily protein (haloacid dehalogenase superfamily)